MSFDSKKNSLALGITKFQLFCVLAGSISTLNSGWNFVVTNIPGDIIIKCLAGPEHDIDGLPSCIPTTDFIWGIGVGSYALGALAGTLACTWFSNNFGRKFVLMYSNVIGLASAILLALPVNIAMFVVARVIAGIAQGAANGTFSSYTVEITTPRARSSLACMTQAAMSIGVTLGFMCSLGMLKPPLWRVLFSLTGVFCLLSMALLCFSVESPKWLLMTGKFEQARMTLQSLRKNADITDEFDQMMDTMQSSDGQDKTYTASVADIVLGRTPENLRHQLLVAVMAMLFQQLSGLCGFSFYSTSLFDKIAPSQQTHDVGKPSLPQILSVVMAIVGTGATLFGMFLANYLGRRALMLLSHGLMSIFCIVMSIGNVFDLQLLAVVSAFIYYAVYFLGSGPLPWTIPNEMTPTYATSAITAINNSIGYLGMFLIGLVYSPMLSAMGGYTFAVFAATNAAAVIFFFFFLPETKGHTVSEVVKFHSIGIHIV
ncbi:Bifunctional purine biosynthesis protein PurH [Coemansia sp. RSA 1358]|uniref:Bifunctional purine biosynthesis protein PurH n=2 Tax=Coemansia TaxID=4863 RepID=A0ABQ8PI42_9FUNG|nr:Bifunctional purine biosynthesis protein PurH [Coemansia umbellata]KAJ2620361.1 Bifunctional purine biosynthesis protein PurH [Coemansia sp. RSA 1358]